MIDFRYHIVSLIAVFLALAVGVVLGAGPLQGSIGDQLTQQIEDLRAEKEQLRVQLDESEARAGELATFVDATSGTLLDGMLTDVDVAVVTTATADGAVTDALIERIGQAGGSVVSQIALTSRWSDAGDAALRDATAKEVSGLLVVAPPAGTANSQVLGMALGMALTLADPVAETELSNTANELHSALVETNLITDVTAPSAPADVVLVVAPAPVADAEPDASVLGIHVATLVGLGPYRTVVAGTDASATDLLDVIRADENAAAAVSTVDSVDYISGQITTALALAALARDAAVGHYGTADGAESVLPVVPDLPEEPEADDNQTDGGEEPTGGGEEPTGGDETAEGEG